MLSVIVFSSLALAAHLAAHSAVAAGGITAGRAQALGAVAVSLASAIVGGWTALRRTGRAPAVVAFVLGLSGIAFASVRLASSAAIGAGSGRLGAIVALVLGMIGTVLGGVALARRRTS
jgi:hypothetical protein